MNDPVRFLDEAPDSDLSSALRAEHDFAGALDGAALKGRLLANVAAGALPSALSVTASTWTTAALPTVLAGLVGVGVGVVGTLAVVERQSAPASVAATTIEAHDDNVHAPSLVATPELPQPPPEPPQPSAPARPTRHVEPAAATTSSSLADETRRYERAEAALRDGRAAVAIDELNGYLSAYPKGSLRDEVRLTLLEALFAAERFREVRDFGETLAADAGLADRRAEIVHLLVRARLKLGECDAAAADLAKIRDAAPTLIAGIARCRAGNPDTDPSDRSERDRE